MRDIAKLSKGKQTLFALGLAGGVLLLTFGIAYVNASAESAKQKGKEDSTANLGQAPSSDSYTQTYQVKLEDMVNQKMKQMTELQEQQQKSASEVQKTSLARQEAMIQTAIAQMKASAPSNDPMAGAHPNLLQAEERYRPTKVYSMGDAVSADGSKDSLFIGSPSDIRGNFQQDTSVSTGDREKKNADAYVIPQSGWIKGRLINGVIGGQTGEFRYTTIKLIGSYYGPNNYSQNLDSCVITGEATPNLPERRFQVKPITLSCTLPNGRNKTWKTSGYVVDAKDGIQGVNGTLVSNETNKLAASVAAGAIESAGAYYNQSAVNNTVSSLTGSVSGVVTNPGKYLAGGVVQGAGKEVQQNLKDYYELFRSTLQVGGGGEVTVHLTSTLELPDGGDAISTIKAAN